MRIIYKGNGGISSERQFGIDKDFVEYTIHADPNNWVEPEVLDQLYYTATL